MSISPVTSSTGGSVLALIWMELLEVTSVSPGDNFIEMGGNSLLATILTTRIEEEAGATIDIEDVFQLTFDELSNRLLG